MDADSENKEKLLIISFGHSLWSKAKSVCSAPYTIKEKQAQIIQLIMKHEIIFRSSKFNEPLMETC